MTAPRTAADPDTMSGWWKAAVYPHPQRVTYEKFRVVARALGYDIYLVSEDEAAALAESQVRQYREALERLEAHMVHELNRLRAIPVPTSTNLRKREYLNDLLALIPADLLRREVGE
jgi:hypothetical protein